MENVYKAEAFAEVIFNIYSWLRGQSLNLVKWAMTGYWKGLLQQDRVDATEAFFVADDSCLFGPRIDSTPTRQGALQASNWGPARPGLLPLTWDRRRKCPF